MSSRRQPSAAPQIHMGLPNRADPKENHAALQCAIPTLVHPVARRYSDRTPPSGAVSSAAEAILPHGETRPFTAKTGPPPIFGGTCQRRRSAKKEITADVDEDEKHERAEEAHRREEGSSHRNQQRDAKQRAVFGGVHEEIICLLMLGIVHRSARLDWSRMMLCHRPLLQNYAAPRWRPGLTHSRPPAREGAIGSFSSAYTMRRPFATKTRPERVRQIERMPFRLAPAHPPPERRSAQGLGL